MEREKIIIMPKFIVTGTVVGSIHLGEYDAETAEEAVEKALDKAYVGFCHQCSHQCENAEVESAEAELVD